MSAQGYDDWTQEERDAFDAIAAEDGLTGRELWERIKNKEKGLDRWGQEYNEALTRLAASCGMSPERFHRELSARIETTHATSECLTLGELENWSNFPWAESRKRHVEGCKFCQGLLEIMNAPINPEHERQFVDEATRSGQQQRKS